jgi:hypothetical protein
MFCASGGVAMNNTGDFWTHLDRLIATSRIVIDRPKGTPHPHYPDVIYPVDYGYLDGTTTIDGGEIDVRRGTTGAAGAPGCDPVHGGFAQARRGDQNPAWLLSGRAANDSRFPQRGNDARAAGVAICRLAPP